MIRQESKKHVYQGMKVGEKEVEVNMLQFVDDT